MNPFAISLSFLILLTALFCSEIYVPLINQQLILVQENELRIKSFEIVSKYRNSTSELGEQLNNIQINGIKINSITKQSINDFESYEIDFSHKNILTNKFFNKNFINSSHKKIFLIADKL